MLIGHFDVAIGQLVVVECFGAFRDNMVTQLRRLQKGDGVADTQGEDAVAVAHTSKGKVGQRVYHAALAYVGTIQMPFLHGQFSFGIAFADFGELCSDAVGKAVILVEVFE